MFVGGTSYGYVWSIAEGDHCRIYITVSEQVDNYLVCILESLCIRNYTCRSRASRKSVFAVAKACYGAANGKNHPYYYYAFLH